MVKLKKLEVLTPPDFVDMRGLLTFQILWELGKEELNGQQIAERIAERRGSKPTAGTIYPALKNLKEEKYIKGRKDGRQVIYQLSSKGRKGLEEASRYFLQAFGDITEDVRVKVKVIVIKDEECK